MARLLGSRTISVEDQEKNNRHNPFIVLLVVGFLLLYLYLFSNVFQYLALPSPEEFAESRGIKIDHVFDDDHNVKSTLKISYAYDYKSDFERLIFYVIVIGTFLTVYFLPVIYKRQAIITWYLIAVIALYNFQAAMGILFAHVIIYLTFHPSNKYSPIISFIAGLLFILAFAARNSALPLFLILGIVFPLSYITFLQNILLKNGKLASMMRSAAAQASVLIVLFGAVIQGLSGFEWKVPLGIFLFFWHWQRVILYHVDYKDGRVPKDISIIQYLSVFLNPAMIASWTWSAYIGQGYTYINNSFLSQDKNKLAVAGIKIWSIAMMYLIFDTWFINNISEVIRNTFDIEVFTRISSMVRFHVKGGEISSVTILVSCIVDQTRWMLLWASVVHFKVGLWRVLGYNVDPHFNKPWLSTNLANLWSRYAFHFRAFLVGAFYYPVFFKLKNLRMEYRVFLSTMAAAFIGNFVWGHVIENLFYDGLRMDSITSYMVRMPYFFLLGLAISISQVYLLKKKRNRKPWTWGPKIITDFLAMYLTIQYYCLIHIFARPVKGGTIWDNTELFLKAFGIDINLK